MARLLAAVLVVVAIAVAIVYAIGRGWLGEEWGDGDPVAAPIPQQVLSERAAAQARAARDAGAAAPSQILFGDLHVHTTYSTDAFMMAMPFSGGDGARPVSDACDFARYCSALDFWSINDHAEALNPARWRQTVEEIRQCNAVSGDAGNPDVVAYLGWEWTQIGTTRENHYGHKNVVLRDLEDDAIPARPIAADSPALRGVIQPDPWTLGLTGAWGVLGGHPQLLDLPTYMMSYARYERCATDVPERELPADCLEFAETPAQLFAKLDDWGDASLVIPHGTTWGYYTPQGSSWDKQLTPEQHDPGRQRLIEVYSGHGNSEEYRDWRAVHVAPDGSATCPEPTPDYLPSCWRAGEIIQARCLEDGEDEATCEARAADARRNYAQAPVWSRFTVPGDVPEEWLDSGQCRDCFQPAFNYRPASSVQYILSLSKDPPGQDPLRFRFGFIASSDNHSARPGTGYKEVARTEMTEARFEYFTKTALGGGREPRAAISKPLSEVALPNFFGRNETERQGSFFLTGGLVAVHAQARDRGAIWDALVRREVYGTSGPRILLWFDLLNAPRKGRLPMGSEAAMQSTPAFEVRAVGSFEQQPGCPDWANGALTPQQLHHLCRGECYHPSDRRRPIARIEVVRVRPRRGDGETTHSLIEDPWRVFDCRPDPSGCTVAFTDGDFPEGRRDAIYYVRAVEAPSLAIDADNLRCERDADGECLSVDLCEAEDTTDDCLAPTEQRAWSSPIFVDYAGRASAPGS